MIFSVVLTIATMATASAQDYNYLTVQQSDGTKTSFYAWDANITFSEGNMVVTQDGFTSKFALTSLTKMYFGYDGTLGIDDVSGQKKTAVEQDEVFDLQGRRVAAQMRVADLKTRLPKGVYVIKNGDKAVKVTVE